MTYDQVMNELRQLGTEQNRKIYRRHGCDIDQFGVSVGNLKQVVKPIRNDAELGRRLLFSDNADAMYLAQWMVSPDQLTTSEWEDRILASNYYMLIEYAIPNIIVRDEERTNQLLERWLDHDEVRLRQAGYSLYALHVCSRSDDHLDHDDLTRRLRHIEAVIHSEANRVRYAMNGFVIAVGACVAAFHVMAKQVAEAIGEVEVSMGETACKVPYAPDSLQGIADRNRIGRKRKL